MVTAAEVMRHSLHLPCAKQVQTEAVPVLSDAAEEGNNSTVKQHRNKTGNQQPKTKLNPTL